MKRMIVVFALLTLTSGFAEPVTHRRSEANFGIFYSSLASHGEWIDADIGFVWRPLHVGHGWRPYLNGRWAWTDHGWYWVSSEPFGWATFHYGRWQYDDYYGWIWIPDRVWGPAWVEWRYDEDYIGWAPLPPHAYFDLRIGIIFRTRWMAPIHYWNFVSCRNFTRTRVVEYVQPIERSERIFGRTRSAASISVDGDRVMNRGIDREYVERRGRTKIDRTEITSSGERTAERVVREGRRNTIGVYRPQFDGDHGRKSVRPDNARRAERAIRIDGNDGRGAIEDRTRIQNSREPAPEGTRREVERRTSVDRNQEQGDRRTLRDRTYTPRNQTERGTSATPTDQNRSDRKRQQDGRSPQLRQWEPQREQPRQPSRQSGGREERRKVERRDRL